MNSSVDVSKVLDGLNPEQRSAVLHTAGPLLVLAGAGTGKTRVITTRIANLLARGAAPSSIVAVSFTRKAGEEMRTRVAELVGDAAKQMRISTFHSLGLAILREQHDHAVLDRGFRVCSAKRRRLICERVFDSLEPQERDRVDLHDLEVSELMRCISSAKTSSADVEAMLDSEDLEQRFVGQALSSSICLRSSVCGLMIETSGIRSI